MYSDKENDAFGRIEQINAVLNQIRDFVKSVSETGEQANIISSINEMVSGCSTLWKKYREDVSVMDAGLQDVFHGMTVKNWNDVESSVFTWETQSMQVLSILEESVRNCCSDSKGLSETQTFNVIRKQIDRLLGEKPSVAKNPKKRQHGSRKTNIMDAVRTCLSEQKYASFKGRATRSEYWNFVLFYYAVMLAVVIVGVLINFVATLLGEDGGNDFLVVTMLIVYVGFLFPYVSVTVRRLHDIGMNGWFLVLCLAFLLVPVIRYLARFALLICCCMPGEEKDNKYGAYIH